MNNRIRISDLWEAEKQFERDNDQMPSGEVDAIVSFCKWLEYEGKLVWDSTDEEN